MNKIILFLYELNISGVILDATSPWFLESLKLSEIFSKSLNGFSKYFSRDFNEKIYMRYVNSADVSSHER